VPAALKNFGDFISKLAWLYEFTIRYAKYHEPTPKKLSETPKSITARVTTMPRSKMSFSQNENDSAVSGLLILLL
jgi:hypothetical protein